MAKDDSLISKAASGISDKLSESLPQPVKTVGKVALAPFAAVAALFLAIASLTINAINQAAGIVKLQFLKEKGDPKNPNKGSELLKGFTDFLWSGAETCGENAISPFFLPTSSAHDILESHHNGAGYGATSPSEARQTTISNADTRAGIRPISQQRLMTQNQLQR